MPYKVHNELPGVGTTAKTLFSVIYYNVYNLTNLAQMVHQERRKGAPGCNTPHLAASRHQERRKGCTGCNTPHLAALRHQNGHQKKPTVKRPPVPKPSII